MKDFLEKFNLDEDAKKGILDFFQKQNKNMENVLKERDTLKSQNMEYSKMLSEFEKNATNVEDLKKQLDNYKNLEKDYKERLEDLQIDGLCKDALKNHKFVNEITEKGIFSELKNLVKNSENKGKSVDELFQNLTKDMSNIFVEEKEENIPFVVKGNLTENNDNSDYSSFLEKMLNS